MIDVMVLALTVCVLFVAWHSQTTYREMQQLTERVKALETIRDGK